MQFVGAKVMAVSAVPCWGRAVVLLVSTSPCFCVLCAVFVALRAHNGQKLAFDGALGQYFRGDAAEEAVPGEFVVPCTWQPRVSEALCMRFNPQSRRRVRNNDCCVPEEA